MINDEDYKFISRLDAAADAKAREAIIKEQPQQLPRTLFNLLNQISKEQTIQYLLTLMDDVLQVSSVHELICLLCGLLK